MAGAIEDALTTQRIALLLSQGPTLIERLIAIAIRGVGVALLPRAATTSTDLVEVRRLLRELRTLPPMPPVETSIDEVERFFSLDAFLTVRELTSGGRTGAVLDLLEEFTAARFTPSMETMDLNPWSGCAVSSA